MLVLGKQSRAASADPDSSAFVQVPGVGALLDQAVIDQNAIFGDLTILAPSAGTIVLVQDICVQHSLSPPCNLQPMCHAPGCCIASGMVLQSSSVMAPNVVVTPTRRLHACSMRNWHCKVETRLTSWSCGVPSAATL